MKAPCPKCRQEGRDASGDNLHLYEDGHGHCHACGYHVNDYSAEGGKVSEKRDKTTALAELELIKTFPIGNRVDKNIGANVCEFYGVRYSSDSGGYQDACYYPYYSGGKLVDFKKRIYPKTFYTITGAINKADLFGENTVPPDRRGLLIITEGEDDALAGKEMLWMCGRDYSIVSMPNGADENGVIDNTVLRRLEFITSFKRVALCFDNDDAGKRTARALAEILAPSCQVRIMRLPDGIKDAYDLKQTGDYRAFLTCLQNAESYTPEDIIEGQDVSLAFLKEPAAQGLSLPYAKLQNKLHGIRPEITILCAGTGIGKTTLAREIDYHLVDYHQQKVGCIFLEEQWKKTGQGFIAIDNNVPLPILRVNPNVLTPEQWQASYDKMFTSGRVNFLKHFGSIDSELLIRKMRYLALAIGCRHITLDHITMTHSGNESRDERKDIDILMTRLAEFVTETNVGVTAIVHLKRLGGDAQSFNEGAEVSLTHLRGSSQLEALSWNVIALERDQQSLTHADVSQLRLLKNREWGFLGLCDKLIYNSTTGRLLPLEQHQQL